MKALPCAGLALAILAATALPASSARADETWLLTLDPAFTTPLSNPQRSQYGPGGSLGIGGYRSLAPWVLIGLRLRGSVFSSGEPPTNPLFEDQPAGGLYTVSAALRFRIASAGDPRRGTGPYAEFAGGPGLTDSLVRGTVEAALGWNFQAGAVDLGPVIRYQHVFHDLAFDNGPLQPDDANLILVGLEMVIGDERPVPPVPAGPEPAPEHPCADLEEDVDGFEDEDGCPDPDNDRDGILDVNDACPMEPETFNGVNDHDGCPDSGRVEIIDDRVVIEEDVFFDFDAEELKPAADAIVRQVVALWQQHPEWVGVIVEGHTDSRGARDYNQRLSERRAEAVKTKLIAEGMARARVATEAFGEMRPRVHDADTEAQHARNRRVEFVVVQSTPADAARSAAPTTPTE